MALSLIELDQQQASATSITRQLASLASGDLIVAFFECQSSTATITPPANFVQAVSTSIAGTTQAGIWAWASNTTTTLFDVVFSISGGAVVLNLEVWQWRSDVAPFTSSAADKFNSNSAASVTAITTGSTGVLSQAAEVAVAAAITGPNNGGTEAIGSGFTLRSAATHNRCVLGDLLTAATTALNPSLSWATTLDAAAMIATFAEPGEPEPVTGTVEVLLPSLEAEASGTVTVTGTATVDLPALDATAAGTVEVTGTAEVALPALDAAASGTVTIAGTADVTLPAVVLEATGSLEVTGTVTVALPALDISLVGDVNDDVAGTVDITLPAIDVELNGSSDALPGSAQFISRADPLVSAVSGSEPHASIATWAAEEVTFT